MEGGRGRRDGIEVHIFVRFVLLTKYFWCFKNYGNISYVCVNQFISALNKRLISIGHSNKAQNLRYFSETCATNSLTLKGTVPNRFPRKVYNNFEIVTVHLRLNCRN